MAESDKNEIYISPGPHYSSSRTTRKIMLSVVFSLLPVAAYGIFLFGFPALVTIFVSVVSCVGFESLFRLLTKQQVRAGDFSAVITGLLLAMTLPPSIPVWMTVLGALFAVVVAKEFFGGLGANVFNPALSGRAFLLVSFSSAMTTWTAPFSQTASGGSVDAVSQATLLSFLKPAESSGVLSTAEIAAKNGFDSVSDLYFTYFIGRRAGCIGESAVPVIIIMGIVLIALKVIDRRAPLSMLAATVAVTWIAGVDPVLTLLSGGLLFGSVFMVTDYATTPQTPAGRVIFGAGCGVIAALIRVFGGYPEGVMFSILIMNAVVPFLNKIIVRKYGWVPPVKNKSSEKGRQ